MMTNMLQWTKKNPDKQKRLQLKKVIWGAKKF